MRFLAVSLLTATGGIASADGFIERFQPLDNENWHKAHYQFSHPAFDTDWDASLVDTSDGLTLTLVPQDGENQFRSASVRRETPTHFGLYEAELQVAAGSGLITGFFLYTGPAYGTQHDEIDWEFFGKDPRSAQAAWFQDGTLRQHKIDLGFDASASVNRYGILWEPDKLTWFVNGAQVFATTDAIPQTPQRLFANLWAADKSVAAWAGKTEAGTKASAQARSIRFTPLEDLKLDDQDGS